MSVQPNFVEYDEEDGSVALRHLELDAYVGIISAFRAQGSLGEEKKSVLRHLQQILGISLERHKAEVRRVSNDEKLSTICFLHNGSLLETSWQKEGRRLVNVFKRATPKNAYTEIANKIAKITANENIEVEKCSSEKRKGKFKYKDERLPESLQLLPNNIDKRLKQSSISMNEFFKCDASTSTNDILGSEMDQKEVISSGPYVYLPGGTIVHMEKDCERKLQKNFKHSQLGSMVQSHSSNVGRKRKICNIQTADSSFVVKEVFRPNEVQAIQKYKLPVVHSETTSINHSVSAEPQGNSENVKGYADQSPFFQKSDSFLQELPRSVSSTDMHCMQSSVKEPTEPYSTGEKSGSIIPQAPVPPEHLYAVGASRSKTAARTQTATWATKHNATTNPVKVKKKFSKSPMQKVQKRLGHLPSYSRLNWSPNSISFVKEREKGVTDLSRLEPVMDSKILSTRAGNELFLSTNLPISDSLFLTTKDSPPQKVFRPSLGMAMSGFHSDLKQGMSSSVETGLASVSSIVSRVSSPAEPLIEQVSDISVTDQASAGKVTTLHTFGPNNVNLKPSIPLAKNNGNYVLKTSGQTLSQSLPTETLLKMCRDKEQELKTSDSVAFEIKSLSDSSVTTPTSTTYISAKAWKADCIPNLSITSGIEKSKLFDSSSSKSFRSVNLTAPGSCASVAPSATCCSNEIKTSPKHKDKLVAEAQQHSLGGNGIIKVASRPTQSKVTQIQSHGNGKPSIIVVHRHPGGKPHSTPAKFLEMGSKGVSKPLTQVKAFGSVSKAVTVPMSTTFVKPVPTKVVSLATNVRNVSGKPVPTKNFHKVITKGKMQQLILKPTIPIVAPNQRQFAGTNKHSVTDDKQLATKSDAFCTQQTTQMHVPTTVKTLMAIQMSNIQKNSALSTGICTVTSQTSTQSCLMSSTLKSIFKPKSTVVGTSKPLSNVGKISNEEEYVVMSSEI